MFFRPQAERRYRHPTGGRFSTKSPQWSNLREANHQLELTHIMVAQSLSSLLQRATIDDHEEVLKSCNEALKKSKNDQTAQHIKAIALLKLDRFDDALRVFEGAGDALKKAAAVEYAYALYKCGKLDEALDVITTCGAGRGAQHLEAQVVRMDNPTFLKRLIALILELNFIRLTELRNSAAPQIYTNNCTKTKLHSTRQTTSVSIRGPRTRNSSGKGSQNMFVTSALRGRISSLSRRRTMQLA